MKYLLVLVLVLASCAAAPTVAPKPSVAPIKIENAATRAAIRESRTEIKLTGDSIKAGNVILHELIPSLTQLQQAKAVLAEEQFEQALAHISEADKRTEEAEAHATASDERADALQGDINSHQKNEERLSSRVNELEPFWSTGHKWWGLGAIFLGLGILFKHLLILAAVLAVLAVLLFLGRAAITTAFPFMAPVFAWIGNLFKKT